MRANREGERPLILVSPGITRPGMSDRDRVHVDLPYLRILGMCGANPVVVTPYSDLENLAESADGWLITGGDDLPPELFGESLHAEARLLHPERLRMERELYAHFRQTAKPILGICFGCQFLNVTDGGSLYQHLPDIEGFSEHRATVHEVETLPATMLRTIVGERLDVASSHHQAIRKVAPGWHVAAVAPDGVIEAIEQAGDAFRLGVQWHPERTPDSSASLSLFRAFVEAANLSVVPVQPE